MELNEYQRKAMETCMPSCRNISYMLLNLVGEVGELASKIAKDIRKDTVEINHNNLREYMGDDQWWEREQEYQHEAGDILWQLSGLCEVMGWDLGMIAQMNLDKLASRKERGVIEGNGDNR